jgi:peroxin-13
MSSYSSPYSRFGGGGGYGMGMGMGMGGGYGMGGYGVGGMGAPGEVSSMGCSSSLVAEYQNLTSSLQASTAPAFAVLESLVTAFTSLAQLVESTYMATHSSFFAMVGVADQLGSVKTYLGQVLGVFSILRLGKRIIAWLRGKNVKTDGWANEWSTGISSNSHQRPGDPSRRPSSKPLLLFLLSAVGLPYLMSRLVKLLIASQQRQQQQGIENLDPTKLTFARAKWEFKAGEDWELGLGRDEIVAVLEKRDEGGDAGWWRGRTRDGRIGWFPGNYVSSRRSSQPTPSSRLPLHYQTDTHIPICLMQEADTHAPGSATKSITPPFPSFQSPSAQLPRHHTPNLRRVRQADGNRLRSLDVENQVQSRHRVHDTILNMPLYNLLLSQHHVCASIHPPPPDTNIATKLPVVRRSIDAVWVCLL